MNIFLKNKRTIIIALVLSNFTSLGQLKLDKIKFKSWFGVEVNGDPETLYCLLGNGFARTTSASNTDSLINVWTTRHPTADVIPVFMFGPILTSRPHSRQIYCWVIDGLDTLNIYLVKNGCIPGSTMLRPKTWDEMDGKQKEEEYDNKAPMQEMYVDKDAFRTFIAKVKEAEGEARKMRIGIWVDK